MAPLNNFILQYFNIYVITFCFRKWKHYIEKHLIANFTRFTLIYKHHLHNSTLYNIGMFLQNGTNTCKISNLYSSWSLLFIKHSVGIKTRNLQRATRFVYGCFIEVSKAITFWVVPRAIILYRLDCRNVPLQQISVNLKNVWFWDQICRKNMTEKKVEKNEHKIIISMKQ